MIIDRQKMASELQAAVNSFPMDEFVDTTKKMSEAFDAINSSKLLNAGDKVDGMLSLASTTLQGLTSTKQVIPSLMQSDIPEIPVTEVSSALGGLSALMGETVSDGFLHSIVTTGNPAGIKAALQSPEIAATTEKMSKALETIAASDEFKSTINTAIKTDLPKVINKSKSTFTTGFLGGTVGGSSTLMQTFMGRLSGKDFSQLSKNLVEKLPGALEKLAKTTSQLNLHSKGGNWDYGNTSGSFRFEPVSTVEELEMEFRTTDREITEIIITNTGHFINEYPTSKDIHGEWKKATHGSLGIPYHYIIRKDGTLQRGIPISTEATNPELVSKKHNKYSILLGIVGGYNCPEGTPNPEMFKESTMNVAQHKTFRKFLTKFYQSYPGGQVIGWGDISGDARNPGFNVPLYISTYNKKNIFTDPSVQESFSPKEINTLGSRLVTGDS